MTGDRLYKLLRSLERHKERYLRAWMAHYGAHPSQVHIVMFPKSVDVWNDERGEIMRLEYRKDTDEVAALVKAADTVLAEYNPYEHYQTISDNSIEALRASVKRFNALNETGRTSSSPERKDS